MKRKYPVMMSETAWKAKLSSEAYHVLRKKGTEPPHSGVFDLHFEEGSYGCAACGQVLFESSCKFRSNCGWPSFEAAVEGNVEYVQDRSFGMIRTESLCSNCGSHLGHVFEDGPSETGERFCINSVSLKFKPKNP